MAGPALTEAEGSDQVEACRLTSWQPANTHCHSERRRERHRAQVKNPCPRLTYPVPEGVFKSRVSKNFPQNLTIASPHPAYNNHMRRLMPIGALVLFLAVPLWAQHDGGHGGGHVGGFAGHSGFSGGHFSGGMRSGPAVSRSFSRAPSFSQRNFSRGPIARRGFGFHGNGFRGRDHRFHNFGFRNNCFGYGCWGGYYPWGYGGIDPYWWWDTGSSYDEDYERDRQIANDMNQQSLEQQQMLRQEEADGDQDAYARATPTPRPAPSDAQPGTPIMPDTVLVFRDQHKQQVHNYAIVGQTLWNFAPGRTERIPLAELDLPATTKANDDQGVTFRVPSLNEGQ